MNQRIKTAKLMQVGSSLLVSLVMLVVLTLLVVSAIRMTNTNLKSVGNIQSANEANEAAQQAIETTISSVTNFYSPLASTIAIDINNDGVTDFQAVVSAPACKKMIPVPGYSADFADSAPKDTYWDVKAVVIDGRTGASTTVHQGVRVRMDSTATCS